MHDTGEWAMTLCIYYLAFPIHLSSPIQWSWSLLDTRSVFLRAFFRVWSRLNRRLDSAVPASDWLLVLEYLQYFQYFQCFGMHFRICAWKRFSGRKRQFVSWDGLWGGRSSHRRENLLDPLRKLYKFSLNGKMIASWLSREDVRGISEISSSTLP